MPEAHSPNPQEQPANIYQKFFPQIDTPDPSSYLEWSGVRQMTIVLGVICIAAVIFLVSWVWTSPTIEDAQALGGANSVEDPKLVLELLAQLQADHFERFRNMFQLVVMSGLIPLFTLLAGYVFGKSKAVSLSEPGGKGVE